MKTSTSWYRTYQLSYHPNNWTSKKQIKLPITNINIVHGTKEECIKENRQLQKQFQTCDIVIT